MRALIGASLLGIAIAGASTHHLSAPKGSGAGPALSGADSARAREVRHFLDTSLDTLDARLDALGSAKNQRARVAAFRDARAAYKRAEAMVAYYLPPLVIALNSAEAQELDQDFADGFKVANGFQLLESELFDTTAAPFADVAREVTTMRKAIARARPIVAFITPSETVLLDVARLELARVSTLGIAGFDAPLSGDAMRESARALTGVIEMLNAGNTGDVSVTAALGRAAAYLREHAAFESFDRFTFVRDYANAAFGALATARRTTVADEPPVRRVWPAAAASVYDARTFDVDAFAPPEAPPATKAWVTLGRSLFFEPALSGDGTRSCASCHVPERGFTDGLPRARSLSSRATTINRHTPSLINAGMQPAQFSDERRFTLEDQVVAVVASPAEMGSSIDRAVSRLSVMDVYRERFAEATGRDRGRAVTARAVQTALASYVRSLTSYDAPFDRAIRGETTLDAPARRGFNLFMGKAACGTCHFAPLFNGTVPPEFVISEPEVIGVPAKLGPGTPKLDSDIGRGAIDRRSGFLHAFKTPTVRNAALGGPYMHNGAFRTLDEVIDFYDRGGGAGLGIDVPNQTLSPRPLHLQPSERTDLIAFLRALVDTAGLTARPAGAR